MIQVKEGGSGRALVTHGIEEKLLQVLLGKPKETSFNT
jgi:hypothetical protein